MNGTYLGTTKYVGRTGAIAVLEFYPGRSGRLSGGKWDAGFNTSRLRFRGIKSKLHALILLAHKCKLSAADMNWEPLK